MLWLATTTIVFRVVLLGVPQAPSDECNIRFGRGDAALRLFLEHVQDVHGRREPHGVDCPVRTGRIVLNELENPGTAKSYERPRAGRTITVLRIE